MPNNTPKPKTRDCALCGKPVAQEFRPFCSRGCRDRDLNAWFDEDYRIPVRSGGEEGDDPSAPGHELEE